MKRILSVFLVLCTVFGLLMPMASAADTGLSEADHETLQKAVVETALAYYYKGNAVQYDSYYIGSGNRYQSAVLRQTSYRSPEDSSVDDIHYTVCSVYPWDVYYNVFGQRLIGVEEQERIQDLVPDAFTNNYDGMGYDEETLSYEYSLQALTHRYIALAQAYQGKNDVSVGYWGPDAWDAAGNVLGTSCDEITGAALLSMLEPGDILAARPKKIVDITTSPGDTSTDDELTDEDGVTADGELGVNQAYLNDGGHTLIFLGDIFGDGVDYVIHSWGAKYNNNNEKTPIFKDETGKQIHGFDQQEEPWNWKNPSSGKAHYFGRNGSIVLTPYDEIIGGGTYNISKCFDFGVLRPINAMTTANLTESAKFRLHHPGLAVTKTASVKPYRDVVAGDEITYTIRIENNTKDVVNKNIGTGNGVVPSDTALQTYKDLVLTETLPVGTTLKKGSSLTWNVDDLQPGETAEFSYTVTVTATSGQIVSPKGTITASGKEGQLQTKVLTHEVVGEHLTSDISVSVTASTAAPRSGMDVAEDVYAAMGYALQLPDGQEMADLLMKEVVFPKETTSRYKTDFQLLDLDELSTAAGQSLRNMIVPGFLGGARLYTVDENNVRTNADRLRVLDEGFVQPGDVLVYLNTAGSRTTDITSEEAYVYLGGSNWAYYENGIFKVKNDPVKTYSSNAGGTGKVIDSDLGKHETTATSGAKKYAYSEILYQAFLQDVFFLLRPSRVGLTETAATDVRAVEIDGDYYADLASAVTAAKDGDTIVLHEDLATDNVTIEKGVTLDLNGHTINFAQYGYNLNLASTGVVLKNGTINGMVCIGQEAHLEDLTLVGKEPPAGGTATYSYALYCSEAAASVTLKNVSISSAYTGGVPWNTTGDYSTITIEDDVKILVPASVAWDPTGLQLSTAVKQYKAPATRSFDGQTKGELADTAYLCYTYTTTGDVYNETQKSYHPSLTHATANAKSGDTLRLLRDIDSADLDEVAQDYETNTSEKNYGAAKYFAKIKGSLTVEMDGHTITEHVYTSGALDFRANGGKDTVTFRNGTIDSGSTAIAGGSVVLENMTVIAERTALFLSSAGTPDQTAYVKDSTLISSLAGGWSGNAVLSSEGTITVQNSTLIGNTDVVMEADEDCSVILEKAKVLAPMYNYNVLGTTDKTDGTVAPAGGYARTAARQATSYEFEGKRIALLMDVYDVTEANTAATAGGEKYASVEQALEYVKSGDTVALANDAAVSADVTVPAGVTVDTGKHKMTLDKGVTLTVAGTVTGEVDDAKGKVKLEGDGNYLGITIPKGVTGTVYADQKLIGDYTITAGSTLQISGTTPSGSSHASIQLWNDGTVKDLTGNGFTIGTVAAKNMNDTTKVALIAKGENGAYYVGKTEEICIRDCVEKLLETATDKETVRALVALLNYGAAAQTYFEHDTEKLANAGIAGKYGSYAVTEDDLKDHRTDTGKRSGQYELIYGTSCVLGEDLRLKMYFVVPEGVESSLTFDVSYNGKTKTVSVAEGLTPAKGSTTHYYLKLEDLSIADFATDVTITVKQDGKEVAAGTDSIRSYLARVWENSPDIANAILSYAWAVSQLSNK